MSEKAKWSKTEKEEKDLWSKKDLVESASEFVYVMVRGKEIVCKKITKADEMEVQKKTLTFSTTTGTLTNVDIATYQLEVMQMALVKPKMTSEELKEMDAALFNEMFVAYQEKIGLVMDTSENLLNEETMKS